MVKYILKPITKDLDMVDDNTPFHYFYVCVRLGEEQGSIGLEIGYRIDKTHVKILR